MLGYRHRRSNRNSARRAACESLESRRLLSTANAADHIASGTFEHPDDVTNVFSAAVVMTNPSPIPVGTSDLSFTLTYTDAAVSGQITASSVPMRVAVNFPDGSQTMAQETVSLTEAGSNFSVIYELNTNGLAAGAYSITIPAHQLADQYPQETNELLMIPAFTVGTVAPPTPTAAVTSSPEVDMASSSEEIQVTYSDPDSMLNGSSISPANITVTGPNDNSIIVESATSLPSGNNLIATYTLTPPDSSGDWSAADNGAYAVHVVANAVYDGNGQGTASADGSFMVGVGTSSSSPLVAKIISLNPMDVTSANQEETINVTYTPSAGATINDNLLDGSNLSIQGPNGIDTTCNVLTQSPSGSGVQVTYQVVNPDPAGIWQAADDGTYKVTVNAGAVSDSNGQSNAQSAGSFTVALMAPVIPAFGAVNFPPNAVIGSKIKANATVVLNDQGSTYKGAISVTLYADAGTSLDGSQTFLKTLKKSVSVKPGIEQDLNFNIKLLPASLTPGAYYLIAQVTTNTGTATFAATTQTVQFAAPFIQLATSVASVTPSNVLPGKSGSILVTVANNGNIAAGGLVITLSPSTDGSTPVAGVTLKTIHSGAKILPGTSKTFKLRFKATSAVPAGSYYPYIAVVADGVTTTMTGLTLFTVG